MAARAHLTFCPGRVDAGDGAALAQAMRDEIAAMYEGLDLDGDTMAEAGAAELSPPGGAFLVGYHEGVPVCCGGVKRLDDERCEIKKMYVIPELYRDEGYVEVPDFNGNPVAVFWGEKPL
jgi:hypothetical protein